MFEMVRLIFCLLIVGMSSKKYCYCCEAKIQKENAKIKKLESMVTENLKKVNRPLSRAEKIKLWNDLREWAYDSNINREAITALLLILRENKKTSFLPDNAHTLLSTYNFDGVL